MPETDVWTIGRLLQWTADYLKQHGSESPRLDAEVLLAAARSCERIELYTAFAEVPSQQVRDTLRQWVRRRAEGTPVAYLVGHREFYSLDFHVTPAVLVPRPETEFVVLTLLDLAKQHAAEVSRPLRVVDVGTGSGVIAVCAAKFIDACEVTAIDISAAALEVAKTNMREHGVQDRVCLLEGDLLQGCTDQAPFDFVVSNPPYLTDEELAGAQRDVRDHEPRGALLGGPTGMDVITRLVAQAAEHLHEGGWLIFEISPTIASQVRSLLGADQRYADVSITTDLARLPRVAVARRAAGPMRRQA